MKHFITLTILFTLSSFSFAQDNTTTFPEDFLGIYKGTLVIHKAQGEPQEIPMEFHLLKTDTTDRYSYILVYDGKPRDYTLVVTDADKGLYEVDENNGIILKSRLMENTLHSYFQVDSSFLSSRLSFSGKQLEFEILFTNMDEKERTGENTEYEIYGYPISTIQKAILARE